ncbi:MAG: glycosyltransferase [Lachnospiraceae bacterium]|nr:glycosyltransferase [Lachnospiraceae bacterium]
MLKSNYKVSIITVVYNGAKTIEHTIQSVLNQSYKNIEYIIIDGLSTDGTQKIVEKYIDSISYFVSEKDNGLYDAMNKGIQKATGSMIGIINSDDWYNSYAVEKVVEYFEKNNVDLVYGKWLSVTQEGKVNEYPPEPLETIWYQMPFIHPSVFIKKNVYENYGGFNTNYKMAADYELMLRLYTHHVKFGYLDEAIAYFQLGGLSAINKEKTVHERYAISMTYIDACPNKTDTLFWIEDAYRWDAFLLAISNGTGALARALYTYFEEKIESVCVFGTGYWGRLCYAALKDGEITVLCFADNDSSKWNTEFNGVKIVNPIELKNGKITVLIAVKDSADEIKRQLVDIGNCSLRFVCIEELRTVCICGK